MGRPRVDPHSEHQLPRPETRVQRIEHTHAGDGRRKATGSHVQLQSTRTHHRKQTLQCHLRRSGGVPAR